MLRGLFSLILALPLFAQPRIAVDPRIELFSIVFHLAGNPEYNQCCATAYCYEVDRYFAPFKDDEAIRLASELNEKDGINYDAVMSMAIHLKDAETLSQRAPLDAPGSRLDARWAKADRSRFLEAMRRFVDHSKFRAFLDAHTALYEKTGAALRSVVESQADLAWFDRFFGAKAGATFIVVPALIDGGANYGPSLRAEDGRDEMYAILGVWKVDAAKQPVFDHDFLPTLVHEFAHSYANPLVDLSPALDKNGNEIYRSVEQVMRAQAYATGHTLICESLVRASTARYILAHDGAAAAQAEVNIQEGLSFVWTGELFGLLGQYEADREHFPTLQSFLPKVTAFFDGLAPRVPSLVQAYDSRRPRIVSMNIANGARDVDPATSQVVMVFDRPLRGGYSFCKTQNPELYPRFGKMAYDESRKIFTIDVRLEPGHDYEFLMNCAPGFVGADGISMKELTVKWHTARAK
ncbi:MAG: hypothetical protein DMG57_38275 [Acidobacteria bacterium]|nr:MAG: hypothetical protein DMG57_38275 [Acidobacteriota bacterium]